MEVIPAVDLRDGKCVQLIGGSYDAEQIRYDDPVAVAAGWINRGFTRLHVVDLDAATGRGSNRKLVHQIIDPFTTETQVGGGLRTSDDVAEILDGGADRVVLGSRAVTDQPWLESIAAKYPGRVLVALDIRGRRVVTHGWTEELDRPWETIVADLNRLPLAGIVLTAVHREGLMGGTDISLVESVVAASTLPVQAAGGIGTVENLRALARCGVSGAILGMALYTGAINPEEISEEFDI
jgi:phosphoribosylformimino-5-aminoimidazole carboxamide ribotide isomerase